LGVLLYEMLHGYAPSKGKSDQEKCANIVRNNSLIFDSAVSSDAADLVRKILKPSPGDRIPMEQIFRHPWMKKYERFYQIDIISYIAPLDEEEPQKVSLTSTTASSIKHTSSMASSAKIITIVDDNSPFKYKSSNYDFTTTTGNEISHAKPPRPLYASTDKGQSEIDRILNQYKVAGAENSVLNRIEDYSKKPISSKGLSSYNGGNAYPNGYGGYGYAKDAEPTKQFSFGDSSTSDTQPSFNQSDLYINQQQSKNEDIERILNSRRGRKPTGAAQNMGSSLSSKGFLNEMESNLPSQVSTKKYERSNSQNSMYNSNSNTRFYQNSKNDKYGKVYKKGRIPEQEDDDETESPRMSKPSKKNREIERKLEGDHDEDLGFFDKILMKFGCITRDNKKKYDK